MDISLKDIPDSILFSDRKTGISFSPLGEINMGETACASPFYTYIKLTFQKPDFDSDTVLRLLLLSADDG